MVLRNKSSHLTLPLETACLSSLPPHAACPPAPPSPRSSCGAALSRLQTPPSAAPAETALPPRSSLSHRVGAAARRAACRGRHALWSNQSSAPVRCHAGSGVQFLSGGVPRGAETTRGAPAPGRALRWFDGQIWSCEYKFT